MKNNPDSLTKHVDKNYAHAQLVARDGKIEITVSALHRRMYIRMYVYI